MRPYSINLWLKLVYLAFLIVLLVASSTLLFRQFLAEKINLPQKDIILETKYRSSFWQGFGEVFEPIIQLPIYYPQKGYQKENFLLDSGAVVSSLPRERAAQMGLSLARLPRTTFWGFGDTISFAYRTNLKVKLGPEEISLPVVFTEAAGTKTILGRSGFFENYSIHFNSKERKIEISR